MAVKVTLLVHKQIMEAAVIPWIKAMFQHSVPDDLSLNEAVLWQ